MTATDHAREARDHEIRAAALVTDEGRPAGLPADVAAARAQVHATLAVSHRLALLADRPPEP